MEWGGRTWSFSVKRSLLAGEEETEAADVEDESSLRGEVGLVLDILTGEEVVEVGILAERRKGLKYMTLYWKLSGNFVFLSNGLEHLHIHCRKLGQFLGGHWKI